ncbi:MAG: rod shape-determining protein MreC [Clostridia bacterium]|nr:rod shape-determining protein MreC [Clostridia bacterium]
MNDLIKYKKKGMASKMRKDKKNTIVGIIITILILIFLVAVSNIKVDKISQIGNPFTKFVNNIQNGMVYLKNRVAGNDQFFINVDEMKQENENLKKENSQLEQSLRELEILKAENATLREYVNLTDKYTEYSTYPAYVIQTDISNYSKTIIINAGKKDGIDVNMTVISDKGLVGHVISVTDDTAKVQTIIDTSSTVTGTISTTRDSIVARGVIDSNKELKASFIPTEANILEGDMLETSGIGGIYPKGIHIGTIKKVVNTKNITNRYALIETAVDFGKLETVLVITN